jgi:hypothetical protein
MDPIMVPSHYHPHLMIANGGALVIIGIVLGITLKNLLQYIRAWDERKENLLTIFGDLCKERQAACGKNMETRIDGVKTQACLACKKVDELKKERTTKWIDQEIVNRKLLVDSHKKGE